MSVPSRFQFLVSDKPVVQDPVTGRWFIAMGQPGFNCPANNADGYPSRIDAATARGWWAKRSG